MYKFLLPAGLLLASLATPAVAMPAGDQIVLPTQRQAQMTPIMDGCGPYGHRNSEGYCRPNGPPGGGGYGYRACPPGYHLGESGRQCWPNR